MAELTLTLTGMAHGGSAVGKDARGRLTFVPFAIPGETVRVRLVSEKERFAQAVLVEVVRPAPERVEPRCRHFGICGNCHFQHIRYDAQLRLKRDVLADQLARVGGLRDAPVRPVVPSPAPYGTQREAELFPADEGGLGYWSPVERRIFRVEACPILHPALEEALKGFDVDLPGLRKLTLRLGDEDELLAALEVDDVEPPELAVDFPISVAIVLPDETAASLIGDPFLVQTIKGRLFRFSPGVAYPAHPAAAEALVDAVLSAADLRGHETVLEVPAGAGVFTAFLAERAAAVLAVEPNPDAVGDAVVNLDAFDAISLYEAEPADVLPGLEAEPDVAVLHLGDVLDPAIEAALARLRPKRVVITAEAGPLARAAKPLARLGYRLRSVQPVDARPQGFWVAAVGVWER